MTSAVSAKKRKEKKVGLLQGPHLTSAVLKGDSSFGALAVNQTFNTCSLVNKMLCQHDSGFLKIVFCA